MTFKEFHDAAHAIAPDGRWLSVKVESIMDDSINFNPRYTIYDADQEQNFTTSSPEHCLESYKKSIAGDGVSDMEISDSTKENSVDSETYPDPKIVFFVPEKEKDSGDFDILVKGEPLD